MSAQTRALYAFYINGGVREVIPIYPLYAIMFLEQGVSAIQLSTLFVIWATVGIVFEVPSGAMADRFSRKWLIVSSGFLKSAAFLTWFLWQDFYGFALGFILWGFGSTLRSGAWEALLHDLLTDWGREAEFAKRYGRIMSLATLGVVLGELSGGLLIVNGFDFVLLVSATIPILATIPFIFFVRDAPKAQETSQSGYLRTLMQGLVETVSNRSILYILLTFGFLLVTFGVYDEYVSPTLFEKGFPLALVAYLTVPVYLAMSAGQSFAHHFEWLTLKQLLALMAASALPLLAIPVLEGIWIPVLITFFFGTFGLASTLFQAHLQSEIKSSSRATVTSAVSLGDSLGAIIWFMVFGTMAELGSMSWAACGLGIGIILLCGLFALLGHRWGITRQS